MTAAIDARGLTVAYGDRVAVDGVSFAQAPGTVLAVLGPNGAGKTTLVRTLSTLVRPRSGTALVAGFDVTRSARRVRERIGLSGQYSAVDADLTVVENLRLLAALTGVGNPRARADRLVDDLALDDIAGRRVGHLSGGNQRRADLALSLVADPEVLFLDEPTTGLDPAARQALWRTVGDLTEHNTSVLLTTQYLEEADQLADRVLVIDGGRLVADGTPSELKRQLGGPVVTITPTDPAAIDPLDRAVASVASVVRSVAEGDRLAVSVDRPASALDVMTAVAGTGIAVDALDVTHPTLDDVFFTLTESRST